MTSVGFIEPNVLVVSEDGESSEYELTHEMLTVLGFQFLKAAWTNPLPEIKVPGNKKLEVL